MDCYGEDLAYIHDQGFSGFSLQSAPGLLGLLRRSGVAGGRVVDLGCGTGIWARQLGFAGYRACGIDASPDMLALARVNAPGAEFRQGSLIDADIPECEAITAIGEGISYAFASNASIDLFFQRIYRALPAGGPFLFDFARAARAPGGMPRKSYWTGEDWAVLVETTVESSDLVSRRLTTFREINGAYRRGEETHRMRLFAADELKARLAAAGFEARRLRGYGAYRFHSGQGGFVATKGS